MSFKAYDKRESTRVSHSIISVKSSFPTLLSQIRIVAYCSPCILCAQKVKARRATSLLCLNNWRLNEKLNTFSQTYQNIIIVRVWVSTFHLNSIFHSSRLLYPNFRGHNIYKYFMKMKFYGCLISIFPQSYIVVLRMISVHINTFYLMGEGFFLLTRDDGSLDGVFNPPFDTCY